MSSPRERAEKWAMANFSEYGDDVLDAFLSGEQAGFDRAVEMLRSEKAERYEVDNSIRGPGVFTGVPHPMWAEFLLKQKRDEEGG